MTSLNLNSCPHFINHSQLPKIMWKGLFFHSFLKLQYQAHNSFKSLHVYIETYGYQWYVDVDKVCFKGFK